MVLGCACAAACALRTFPMTGLVAGCSIWRSDHKFPVAETKYSSSASAELKLDANSAMPCTPIGLDVRCDAGRDS